MKRIKGGSHQDALPSTYRNAAFLRKKMTRHELLVWEKIRNKQIHQQKFRRQHPIGRYILDFFCIECKLSIEVDGESHLSIIQMEYDLDRSKYLTQFGIKEIRVTNNQIDENLTAVIELIGATIKKILNG